MKSFVSYTNCVGIALWEHYLKPHLSEYTFYNMTNYEMIRDKTPIPVDIVREADVFMYQPIDERNGVYHTTTETGILQYLKPSCVRICLPVVGADMFPVYGDLNGIIRGPVIDRSVPLSVLLLNYDLGMFSFGLRQRFDKGMQHMKMREQMCNVKVADFILEHYRDYRMFTTQNHPSGMVLAHIANQMCSLLGVNATYNVYEQPELLVGETGYPDSIHMKQELGLRYPLHINNDYYRKLLIYMYNNPDKCVPTKTMLLT